MTDLFAALLQRARAQDVLAPELRPRFEPVAPGPESWAEIEELVQPRPTPERAGEPPRVATPTTELPDVSPPPAAEHHTGELAALPSAADNRIRPWSPAPGPAPATTEPVAGRATQVDIAAILEEALRRHAGPTSEQTPRETARVLTLPAESPLESVPEFATPAHLDIAQAVRAGEQRRDREAPVQPLPPAVEVRIERIEVNASPQMPSRPAPPPRPERTRAPRLSLADCLARRSRR